jgi:hypothetical protein
LLYYSHFLPVFLANFDGDLSLGLSGIAADLSFFPLLSDLFASDFYSDFAGDFTSTLAAGLASTLAGDLASTLAGDLASTLGTDLASVLLDLSCFLSFLDSTVFYSGCSFLSS